MQTEEKWVENKYSGSLLSTYGFPKLLQQDQISG